MDGYFERGEIYWVKMGMGVGSEMDVTRPGLIVSCNEMNMKSPTVLVAFTTTRSRHGASGNPWDNVSTLATGRESWVLCNQIQAVDKSRFATYLGTMNSADMQRVDDALEATFDLGYNDTAALTEKDREIEAREAVIAEKDAEIAALKAQIAANTVEQQSRDDSFTVEIAMWQRLYEKALNQVVDMKYTNDLFLKNHMGREEPAPTPTVVVTPPVVEVAPVVEANPENPEDDGKVDVNHCTITALKKLGFSLPMARLIVSRRPYKTVEDLKSVPGMKSTQYRIMEPKLCCTPMAVEPEKIPLVNDEQPDPGYEVEPVEEPVVVAAEEPVRKVNVNTATAQEIRDATGMGLPACYAITGKRKRDGLFKSLDEIVIPGRVTESMLAKYRDKLEV